MIKKMIQIHTKDNVATSLSDIQPNDIVTIFDKNNHKIQELTALMPVSYGNKIALSEIPNGFPVIKYGEKIGISTKLIAKGQLVHVHNVRSENLNIPDAIITEIIKQMNIQE